VAREDFERLRALVLADPALQDELFAERVPAEFVAAVMDLARDRAVPVSELDVWEAYSAGAHAWNESQAK